LYGGAAYEENRIFTVRKEVQIVSTNTVIWVKEREHLGIFAKALAKVEYLSEIEICIEMINEELV
jgi:hypothetical protein